jgi:hypothetical protein
MPSTKGDRQHISGLGLGNEWEKLELHCLKMSRHKIAAMFADTLKHTEIAVKKLDKRSKIKYIVANICHMRWAIFVLGQVAPIKR